MLTAEGCANRRRRLWDALSPTTEMVLLADPKSLIYFANYDPSPFIFRSCDASALLVLQRDKSTLIGDKMARMFLDRAHADDIVAPVWYDGHHAAPHRQDLLVKTALDELRKIPGLVAGCEQASVPAGIVQGLQASRSGLIVTPVEDVIRAMRRVKDPDEIEVIRKSIRAGEAGHAAALAEARPGMTELDVYAIVQRAAVESAGDPVIVYGDFVSGPRCVAERGGPPSLRKIEKSDLFLLDYSVVAHGYRGDFTNTFAVGGPPTSGERALFQACLEAMEAAESVLRAGAIAHDLDRAAKAKAEEHGFRAGYVSHTGHGLGLSHPEPPYFVDESEEVVLAGDVVAIEPGLFLKGVGGVRYERNYLVTDDGFENLTHHRLTLDP